MVTPIPIVVPGFIHDTLDADPKSHKFKASLLIPVVSEFFLFIRLNELNAQIARAPASEKNALLERKIEILDATFFSSIVQMLFLKLLPYEFSSTTARFLFGYCLGKTFCAATALYKTYLQKQDTGAELQHPTYKAAIVLPVVGDIVLCKKLEECNRQLARAEANQKPSILKRKIEMLDMALIASVVHIFLYNRFMPWTVPLSLDCLWCTYICLKILSVGNALVNSMDQHHRLTHGRFNPGR